ncbi:hypothetical protein Tco_0652707 [Tanacetum coccineum]|uniref:Uncharacterized protein n=1 Tax=Tanacetum coccineum TaxID=301880 RepID=A0ABQ4WYN8_9ASTR
MSTAIISTSSVLDFQDSLDDEEDTRSSQEYMNDLELDFQERALLAKSKRLFKKGTQRFSGAKATDQTECHKCEEVSSDDNEVTEVMVLIALADDENVFVGKESSKNGEWVKISMRKAHTLLEMEDDEEGKTFLDYFCIDLNYVEEERNNLVLKHRDLFQELDTCKEQLLVLKQAKLDFLTMQHVNTEILKENQNLKKELKELTKIMKTWLNSSNKVNQCISEQIPDQKKIILGVDQLYEDPSNSGQKDLVFVKSLTNDTNVSIPSVERPWLSEAEGFSLPNHDTGRILPTKSQVKVIDSLVNVTESSITYYDSVKESSSVSSTHLPLLDKLASVEPVSRAKTIKSILKSNSTSKADTLKGVTINEPTLTPAKGNKNVSSLKKNSAPTSKLNKMKTEDDIPMSVLMKELNDLKLQISKNQSSYSRNNKPQQCERTDHRTCDHVEYMSSMNMSQHLKSKCSQGGSSSRSQTSRPLKPLVQKVDLVTHGQNGTATHSHIYVTKVFNWETAKYGKIWYDEDVHDLRSVETKFPAIVFDDAFTSEVTHSYEPTVSPLNDNKIDLRISFDESDDEDYTVIYDKNSFSYKIISVNDLKTDSKNDNDKVNMPSFLSPEPTVSSFDDLDFFKYFENEFPVIVYNDALTSKSDFLTEPTISIQHIDEFNLKDEISLSECDEEEQNVLYFNDVFPFNIIYPDDSKSDKDNDDDKIDIKQSSGGSVINTDVGAYAQGSNKLLETRPRERNIDEYWWRIYKSGDLEVLES